MEEDEEIEEQEIEELEVEAPGLNEIESLDTVVPELEAIEKMDIEVPDLFQITKRFDTGLTSLENMTQAVIRHQSSIGNSSNTHIIHPE